SPDGSKAYTAGYDQTVRIWDVNMGREIGRFQGVASPIHCMVLSRDGSRLVAGTGTSVFKDGKVETIECTAKVWDVKTGQLLNTAQGQPAPVNGLAISPDNRRILAGSNTLRLLDLQVEQQSKNIGDPRFPCPSVDFSPDGKRILGTYGSV